MLRSKIQTFIICALCLFWILCFGICHYSFAQEELKYDDKGKRDPFIPLVTPGGVLLTLEKEDAKTDLTIEGIIYDKQGSSYAIINGEVARVGDFTTNGYQVLKIEDKKVIFIKEGNTREVRLKEDNP
jgi:hypothetical protein